MKRTHLILLATALTLTISSCKDQKQGNATSDADNDNVEMADKATASDDKAPLPERGEFSFATDLLVENDEDGAPIADSIVVHIKLKGKDYLTLGCTAMPLDTTYWTGFGDVKEDDINFDGFADLQVCLGPSNGFGNHVYEAWLWNTKTHQFDNVEEYSEITAPEPDPDTKRIKGSWRLDDEYVEYVYKWQDGKLVQESSKSFDLNELYEEE